MSISSFIELRCARLYEHKLILNLVRLNCASMAHLLRADQDFALSYIHGSESLLFTIIISKATDMPKDILSLSKRIP